MADNNIDLSATFDTSEATKGVKDFGKEAEKSINGVNRSVDELQSNVKKTSGQKITFDTSGSSKAIDLLKGGIIATGAAIAAAFTIGAIKGFFSSIIEESIDAENNMNQLNAAMQRSGTYTAESVKAMQDFSAAMMATSVVDDDVIIGQLALAKNFAKTDEQARKLVEAALNLSAATGTSLDQSVELLGRTLDGTAGRLNETVPALRGVSAEALKTGAAIDIVAEQFGGAATSKLNTFQGAMAASGNAFGNLLASMGDFITQNPIIIQAIKEVTNIFSSLTNEIGDSGKKSNTFVTNGLLAIISATRAAIPSLSGLGIVFKAIGVTIDLAVKSAQNLIDVFFVLYDSWQAVTAAFNDDDAQLIKSFNAIGDSVDKIVKRSDELALSFENAANTDAWDNMLVNFDESLERMQESAKNQPIEIKTNIKAPSKEEWKEVKTEAEKEAPVVTVPTEKKDVKSPDDKAQDDAVKRQNELFEKFISDLAAIPAKFIGSAGGGATGAQQAVPGVLADLSSTLGQGLGTVLGGTIGSAIGSGIGSALGEMIKLASGDKKEVEAKIDEFFNAIPKVLENIVNNLPMIAERVMGELPNVMMKLMEAIPAIIMAFANALDDLAESLVMNSPALIQLMIELPWVLIKAATVAAINIAKGIGTGVARLIKEKLAEASRVVFEKLDEAVERIAQFFNGITDFFKSLSFAELGAGLKSAVTGLFDGIKNFFKDAKDLFSLKLDFDFGEIFNKLKDGIGSLFSVENLEKLIDAIIEGFNKLFDKLKIDSDKLKIGGSAGNVLQSWGNEVTSWIGGRAAKGGIVPSGFPNDNYPAMLTSNEVVIPAATTPNLFSLIDSLANGNQPSGNNQTNDILKQILIVLANQERTIEVKLERDTLAKAIVSLNKDNRRLA